MNDDPIENFPDPPHPATRTERIVNNRASQNLALILAGIAVVVAIIVTIGIN